MAKANILNKPPITLTLSHEEAVYIKELLQNPLGFDNPSDEPPEISVLRSDIWVALNEVISHE